MFIKIFKDRYLRWVLIASVAVFLIALIIAGVKFITRTEPVIIHFDAFKGIDVVGNKIAVFGILFAFLSMLFVNFSIADFIYNRERFLSYIFSAISLLLSIFILIFIVVIVSVN